MEPRLTKAELKKQRHEERQSFESQIKQHEQRAKMKKLTMWIGGIVVLALCVWGLITLVNAPTTPTNPNLTAPALSSTDIVEGSTPSDATQKPKITLIEYADFQCPACGLY